MVTVSRPKNLLTDSEVASLTVFARACAQFCQEPPLGFIARARKAAGLSADHGCSRFRI